MGIAPNPPKTPMVFQDGTARPEWWKFFLWLQQMVGGPSNPFDDAALLAGSAMSEGGNSVNDGSLITAFFADAPRDMFPPFADSPGHLTAGSGLTGGGNMGSNVSLALAKAASFALFDHYATADNGTTVETTLYSDTLAAGQLATNGDKLAVEYGGVFVSSGTATRQVKIYFGGTAIFDSGALTLSLSAAWTIYCSIIRVSGTVIRYMVSMTTEGAALAAYTATGELTGLTLSNTNIVKITGQAAGVGAASADISARLGTIGYIPAA